MPDPARSPGVRSPSPLLRWRRPLPWRVRLLLPFLALLLPVALFDVWNLRNDYKDQVAAIAEEQTHAARALATALDGLFDNLQRTLAVVAFDLEQHARSVDATAAYLAGVLPLVGAADLLFLVGSDGRVVSGAAERPEGTRLLDRPPVGAVLSGMRIWAVGALPPERATDDAIVGVAHVVRGRDGRPAGALVAAVRAAALGAALDAPPPDADTALFLVDAEGRAVFYSAVPDLAWVLRDWSDMPDVRAALRGETAIVQRASSLGDPAVRLGATVPAPGTGWAVGFHRDRRAALAPVVAAARRQVAAWGAVLALVAIGAWAAAGRIARPVGALTSRAEALGQGRLDARVPPLGDPAFDRLGEAFNAMAMSLERQVALAGDARRRSAFLAEAGARLAASLDVAATLEAVARLPVPALADYAAVDLLEADGRIRRVAVAHRDPSRAPLVQALARRGTADPTSADPVARVLATGRGEAILVTATVVETVAAGRPEVREALGLLEPHWALVVPLSARGRTLGALSLAASRRRYGADDLALAGELARRAALSLDNARLHEEAREAVRVRDDFLARASHELRTPLTVVKGHLALLTRRLPGRAPDAAELVRVAARHVERMTALIADLLDASRLAAGIVALEPEPVSLGEVVGDVLLQVGPLAREKSVILLDRVPPGVDLVADRGKLEQVVVNLVENGVKFTPPGGSVTVEGSAEGGRITLRVRDTGQGIAPEHLERVFDPFFQAGSATGRRKASGQGAGLGLAIARRLVVLHGGWIAAESEGPGRGTTFVVTLPQGEVVGPAEEATRREAS